MYTRLSFDRSREGKERKERKESSEERGEERGEEISNTLSLVGLICSGSNSINR